MNDLIFEKPIRESHAFKLMLLDTKQRLGHAYMVISPDDEVINEFFTLVSAAVFCDTNDACFNCTGCKKVLHRNNEDIIHINEEGLKINAEMARSMLNSAYIKSLSDKKLIFIHRADLMNPVAQNAILKTLEEPPEDVTIFLGVANESSILTTIKSRSRMIHIDLFEDEIVYSTMKSLGIDEEKSKIAAICSEGHLGKALAIAKSENYSTLYKNAVSVLTKLGRSSDVVSLDSYIDKIKDINEFLDILSIIFRSMLLKKHLENSYIEHDDEISKIIDGFSDKAIGEIVLKINEERKKLSLNVPSISVIDDLLFYILEAKHKWQ